MALLGTKAPPTSTCATHDTVGTFGIGADGTSLSAEVPSPPGWLPRPRRQWRTWGAGAVITRQKLDHAAITGPIEPCEPRVWMDLVGLIAKRRVPELAGLRATRGFGPVLGRLFTYAGTHGDRAFVSSRTIAEETSYSVQWVRHVRDMARDCGLLLRRTHGARRGAVDVLACPGGTAGAQAIVARIRSQLRQARRAAAVAATHDISRATGVDAARAARELIAADPALAGRIAAALGQDRFVREGALRCVTEVLYRAGRREFRKSRSAYVMRAIRNDATFFAALWPGGSDPPPDPRVVDVAARLSAAWRPSP